MLRWCRQCLPSARPVVPGGKADMMFTALDFGDDEPEEDDDAFMDFL